MRRYLTLIAPGRALLCSLVRPCRWPRVRRRRLPRRQLRRRAVSAAAAIAASAAAGSNPAASAAAASRASRSVGGWSSGGFGAAGSSYDRSFDGHAAARSTRREPAASTSSPAARRPAASQHHRDRTGGPHLLRLSRGGRRRRSLWPGGRRRDAHRHFAGPNAAFAGTRSAAGVRFPTDVGPVALLRLRRCRPSASGIDQLLVGRRDDDPGRRGPHQLPLLFRVPPRLVHGPSRRLGRRRLDRRPSLGIPRMVVPGLLCRRSRLPRPTTTSAARSCSRTTTSTSTA